MNSALTTASHFSAVVAKTKRLLSRSEAGVNGIRSLSRALGIADDCGGASTTTREAFVKALSANAVELTEKDVSTVFAVLDRAGNGTIDPAEFIAAMRCDLSPLRQCWLTRVWLSFESKDDRGCVAIPDLRAMYKAAKHPDVVKGTRSAAEIEQEFEATFNATTNPDGTVSQQEFEEYFTGVSASCCDDESFTALLRAVWPLPGVDEAFTHSLATGVDVIHKSFSAHQTAAVKKSISHEKNMQTEMLRTITQDHRPRVMASGMAVRELSRGLRQACLPGYFITADDFTATLSASRLSIPSADAIATLDTNGDGSVDILYYLALLLPPLPPARRLMLERLWQTVFTHKDAANCVDVRQFQSRYVAKNGPGRDAFLSAWDVRAAVAGRVSLEEFVEWYNPISANIQLDKDFEALLKKEWIGFGSDE